MGTSTSKASETQRLLGDDDSDARFAAAATVSPPSADYGTTSPPRSASPPATRKAPRASHRGLEPTRRSGLSEEEEGDSDDDDTNSESLTSETIPSPSERRRTVLRFILLWSSISAVTIYLVVEAFRRGGGEFDWKGALKKAAGGGIAGAMAMVIQVLTLMPLRTIMKCVSASSSFPIRTRPSGGARPACFSSLRGSQLLTFQLPIAHPQLPIPTRQDYDRSEQDSVFRRRTTAFLGWSPGRSRPRTRRYVVASVAPLVGSTIH